MQRSLAAWEDIFRDRAAVLYPPDDPSHDLLHIGRVVATARKLAEREGADVDVVLPAAYFHDCVNVPKNDPRRKQASTLSADAAVAWLADAGYPAALLPAIHHAIAAHSFSAGIPAETAEARVVQDADRLDSLGAIGIARCMTAGALMRRPYYCAGDILAEHRNPDDAVYTVDHFFVKLLRLTDTMQTAAGREEARKRSDFMRAYLAQLQAECAA